MTPGRGILRGLCVLVALSATLVFGKVAVAMTSEDCLRIRDELAKALPAVGEMRISPSVTPDGWCRVIDGPLGAGLEWRVDDSGGGFSAELRQRAVEIEGLGTFDLSGRIEQVTDGLEIGPFLLRARSGEIATVTARVGAPDDGEKTFLLEQASLRVASDGRLLGDVLAWAFRLDKAAARSNFTIARDQRDDMLAWLNDLSADAGDAASRETFAEIVRAYPNPRGTAVLSAGGDGPVEMARLIAAVLYGESFTRGEGAALIGQAGLRLTWLPD